MRPPTRTLVGCVLLSGALGTMHAYSLFIEPFESALGVGRGGASSAYSVALASLTVVVLVGHPLFRRVPGPLVALVAAGGAALGLLIASTATSLTSLVVGYGVVFGAFNGLGYAFSLQRAAEANPGRRGLALGLVTAAYALGGASAAVLLDGQIAENDAPGALRSLALAIAATGIATSLLVGTDRAMTRGPAAPLTRPDIRLVARLWAAYGLAVFAGLMALGHGAAIVDEAGGPAAAAVALAGLASASGGVWIALIADRTEIDRLLRRLPVGSAGVLALAAMAPNGVVMVVALAGIAFAYGAVIAVYPLAVARSFGEDGYPPAYGRVFTAWGAAGLVGPFGAGLLFEATGTYRVPLLVAAAAAIGSTITVWRMSVDQA